MGMSLPDQNDFVEDEPLPTSAEAPRPRKNAGARLRGARRKISTAAGDTWRQTKSQATTARERTEFFLRENPVPMILGALTVGLAIGFVIRYASEERHELEIKSPLGRVNWGVLSLPFLWPFLKSVREKYEDSAETVRHGVNRLKKIDLDDYAKPLRKRWKAWVR
jgi:ElaB/YqjD/DUF883 family membrane-anchored ribosome-binding protein